MVADGILHCPTITAVRSVVMEGMPRRIATPEKYVKSVLNWRNRYNDQSSIWLASHLKDNTIKSDGWEPARTRTEVALKNSLRKYERMVSSRDF